MFSINNKFSIQPINTPLGVMLLFMLCLLPFGSALAQRLSIDTNTVLTQDLNLGFDITADHVILDCAGHRIKGRNRIIFRSDVTIKNCRIVMDNDGDGIEIGLSENIRLIDNSPL